MHPVIMYVVIINLGHSQMVNDLSILSTWIAMVTLSYVAALWLSLYMEQPFIQLEKLILHRN